MFVRVAPSPSIGYFADSLAEPAQDAGLDLAYGGRCGMELGGDRRRGVVIHCNAQKDAPMRIGKLALNRPQSLLEQEIYFVLGLAAIGLRAGAVRLLMEPRQRVGTARQLRDSIAVAEEVGDLIVRDPVQPAAETVSRF